jgi:hypothetical protein
MFAQLDDIRNKPDITRGTEVNFLLMVVLLGLMVGAQLTDMLRHRWSIPGIGETFLVYALLWKFSVPLCKVLKSITAQDIHAH